MIDFSLNQIVKGKFASGKYFGTFFILGFRMISGNRYAQLKEINPLDWSQMAPDVICLPLDCLEVVA
jgi:hypothetical protein